MAECLGKQTAFAANLDYPHLQL